VITHVRRPRWTPVAASATDNASAHRDQARYNSAGQNLAVVLLELQSHAHIRKSDDRQITLAALVDAWMIAAAVAKNFGYLDLSLAAIVLPEASRGFAARVADGARRRGLDLVSPHVSGGVAAPA
jgi:hypothetical protein